MKRILNSLLVAGVLALGLPALAETPRLEINFETEAFTDRSIEQGPIRVVASYAPFDYQADDGGENLGLEIDFETWGFGQGRQPQSQDTSNQQTIQN
ncbi:MAG: hypothetical protein AAFW95_06135, partial [Cyanobacteria bacterium J06638_6]